MSARTLVSALALSAALAGAASAAPPRLQSAVFAGGCFWTVERGFEAIPGVVSAVSGYSGGPERNPTYAQVSSETTGHLESVKVTFDPARISYAALVERYWRMIDPTDSGGQACDRGPSYRSAIFVADPGQRKAAEASKAALERGPLKGRIVVPIRTASAFWPAEAYHQDYARRHPVEYGRYRIGCGRDRVLQRIWGAQAPH
jgi:peptide-methionine (S)-S-oxide reductase